MTLQGESTHTNTVAQVLEILLIYMKYPNTVCFLLQQKIASGYSYIPAKAHKICGLLLRMKPSTKVMPTTLKWSRVSYKLLQHFKKGKTQLSEVWDKNKIEPKLESTLVFPLSHVELYNV